MQVGQEILCLPAAAFQCCPFFSHWQQGACCCTVHCTCTHCSLFWVQEYVLYVGCCRAALFCMHGWRHTRESVAWFSPQEACWHPYLFKDELSEAPVVVHSGRVLHFGSFDCSIAGPFLLAMFLHALDSATGCSFA